ncbi:kinase-like domain, phloem protein 2-like protein [Tanacetum coccineum]
MMSSPDYDHLAHLKIPFENIRSATNNFAEANVIGIRRLATRYKGQLLWSSELIDISARRFNTEYEECDKLFWTEVSMLSGLKHQNLISFVGFCDENGEKIVICKHETRGRLAVYLSDPFLLTWAQRLKISVGLAHALSYIHYDEPRDFSVIHRSISSPIVLLNDNWEPKLSEFTLSMKITASQRHHSFHTNDLEYASGYGDPTYIETKSVNHKSDMYSFGILLFELLCARRSVIDDQQNTYLAPLAITHYREKKLNEITDWDLLKQMDSQSFNIFAEIAYDCLNAERSQRPNIDEIVTRLEKALELQLEHQNAMMSKEFAHLRVPLENILSATNNFAEENVIGESGFEKRYKGQLLWSGELINIIARRLYKERDDVKEQQFWVELSILSSLEHKNLISIVGFCDENAEKIIIKRNETRGWLEEYLSNPMLLTWVRRLKICVGLVHALSYIHYDEPRAFSIIHCDIRSSTVQLNDDWEPMLSNFECSMKIKATQRHHSFHTNELEYVNGYADPTYIETKTVNHKSDMYSFGILMFELLCGRKAVIADLDNKHLAPVSIFHYRGKILNEIIDWDLSKQMESESFNTFAEIAYDCLNEERLQRPNIDETVTRLEKALELQLKLENGLKEHTPVAAKVDDASSTHEKGKGLDHLKIGLRDIKMATENFSDKYCIGFGGFGRVYKAQLEHFDSRNYSLIEGENKCDLPMKRSTVLIT